ncbi:Thp2p KNAG_0E00690 [Huiozyma naganishii CBS 8797]|uniref:Uncharacterized protein n=1 Tax=Huiozyma naganishii (strain ATCC MYA-139 / BCRC 22969 / CBS 8797 / KCTC 17520 / NBRC 10181 / NCYC 3082 / Yp74L-3) TaxID=1071383 RepID=J7RYT2_HUIN7|nr:hypothetical protein KNAG_0E00690 [Kazachstania naganishii CBS 8797]CCK70337.1 hypothetical protein KNAG_0E00690 [Kazachstania naganishii CBS 8797]
MSSEHSESEYFDSLCELDQHLLSNHESLQNTLDQLSSLVGNLSSSDNAGTDADAIGLLDELSTQFEDLLSTSVDLKYNKYHTRECQILHAKNLQSINWNLSRSQFGPNLREYVTYIETINKNSLEYLNLLGTYAVDLARQIEISDPSVSHFDIDDWKPPRKLLEILDKFQSEDCEPIKIRDELQSYLDNIKLSRAKFTLENKHILQDKLGVLSKEVSYWRKEWDNIENMMFGEGSDSMRSMLQTVDSLRSKINDENTDIEMS